MKITQNTIPETMVCPVCGGEMEQLYNESPLTVVDLVDNQREIFKNNVIRYDCEQDHVIYLEYCL